MIPTTTLPTNIENVVSSTELIAQCNAAMGEALTQGLIIGAIAGMVGMYIGMWYRGYKQRA